MMSTRLFVVIMQNYKRGEQGWEIGDMTFQYIDNSDLIAPVESKLTIMRAVL